MVLFSIISKTVINVEQTAFKKDLCVVNYFFLSLF